MASNSDSRHDGYCLFGSIDHLSDFGIVMWQELIVFGLFVSVIGYVGYATFLKKKKKKNGCGCDGCG
ncbi:FeoB-associated Cys-rich membrane protein [Belliella kenyensis]